MKLSAILLIIVFATGCQSKKPPLKTGLEGKPMPMIKLLTIDSTTVINTSSIASGKPIILFAFETWCPYCKAEAKSIISKIKSFKDVNIYMLSYTSYPEFKKFYNDFELNKYPNIKAGVDYNMSFAKYFKSSQIPYVAVYDGKKNLKQVFIGKTPVSIIKETALE